MMGGINCYNLYGDENYACYIIENGEIKGCEYMFGDEPYVIYALAEFYEKYPYKLNELVLCDDGLLGIITKMEWDCKKSDMKYHISFNPPVSYDIPVVDNKWYSSKNIKCKFMESCKCPEYEDIKKVAYLSINDKDYADEIEVNLGNDYEYKFEMNRLYILKKKPKYPKLRNLTECKEILGEKDMYQGISGYKGELLTIFQRLLIFRDVYWKIAGEEMGLDKPWEPKYEAFVDNTFFTIQTFNGEIDKSATSHRNSILVFPTIAMRDVFYENFKDLIEQCKELL
jgi:hypothetical protein